MKKTAFLGILFLLSACTDKRPEARCQGAGAFVMTLKNEPARIIPDKKGKFYIHFNPEGGLKYNTKAYPCNLGKDFQAELNVFFDGDFYEQTTDSTTDFIVYIRDMDYR